MRKKVSDLMGLIEDSSVSFRPEAEEAAAERILDRVNAQLPKQPKRRPALKRVLAWTAAAVFALCGTAFAVDYVVNQRSVFFFDTLEAANEAVNGDYREQMEETGEDLCLVEAPVPNTDPVEPYDGAKWAEETAANFDGIWADEGTEQQVLCDEQGGEDDLYTRKMVLRYQDEWRGGEVDLELYTSTDMDALLRLQELVKLDLSWLTEHCDPDADANLLRIWKDTDTGKLVDISGYAFYRFSEDSWFDLQFSYDAVDGQQPEYQYEGYYDYYKYYTTADGVEFTLYGVNGRSWGSVTVGDAKCSLYAEGCTVEQLRTVADHLDLAAFVEAFGSAS